MVDHNKPFKDNIPYFGALLNEGELYDGQVW